MSDRVAEVVAKTRQPSATTLTRVNSVAARLRALYHTPHRKKVFRYAMVSVVSTVVSQGTLLLFFGVFHVDAVFSNVVANVVATVPAYYLTRNWAWGKSGKSHIMKEVVPFWVLSFAGLLLSSVTVGVAQHLGQSHHLRHGVLSLVVNGANLFGYGVLWVLKFLIYNKLFHVPLPGHADQQSVEV